jgi:phosphonate transport system substrate-binding protein
MHAESKSPPNPTSGRSLGARPLLALLLGLLPLAAGARQAIRFAPLPLETPKIVHEQFSGLADYLSERANVDIVWVSLDSNTKVVDQFRAGAIDLAYLGPLPYVILARDYQGARPLACFRDTDGAAGYTCSLVTFADSGLTLERLKGVRFGLTQPYSTCGYLAASQMLAAAGLSLTADGNSFSYAGNHSEAALGVVEGRYDVAGIKTSIAARYRHLGLDVIATSPSYPGFSLVANAATLDQTTIDRLQEALLRLDPGAQPALAERMKTWGDQIRHGTVPPGECDYSGVAAALTQVPWPIPTGQP